MRISLFLLLASCATEREPNPLADEVNSATGYQVLACLPLNYAGGDETFGAVVTTSMWEDDRIEFRLLGHDGAPLHCALMPFMPIRTNFAEVIHYTITFDEPLKENKRGDLTLVYFPSTFEAGQDGIHKVMTDYREGILPAKTRLESPDRQTFGFNMAPTAMNTDVTIAVLPVPEGGFLNPVR